METFRYPLAWRGLIWFGILFSTALLLMSLVLPFTAGAPKRP